MWCESQWIPRWRNDIIHKSCPLPFHRSKVTEAKHHIVWTWSFAKGTFFPKSNYSPFCTGIVVKIVIHGNSYISIYFMNRARSSIRIRIDHYVQYVYHLCPNTIPGGIIEKYHVKWPSVVRWVWHLTLPPLSHSTEMNNNVEFFYTSHVNIVITFLREKGNNCHETENCAKLSFVPHLWNYFHISLKKCTYLNIYKDLQAKLREICKYCLVSGRIFFIN